MSFLEQSATNDTESPGELAPLTWSVATARARALREAVESLLEADPSTDPSLSSLTAPPPAEAPTPSLVESPLAEIEPLPAPPTPPSHLGLPVLPVPPVPPVFSSTDADPDTAQLDTPELLEAIPETASDAPSETELANLIAAHSMPPAAIPPLPEMAEAPEAVADLETAALPEFDESETPDLIEMPALAEVAEIPEAPAMSDLFGVQDMTEADDVPIFTQESDIFPPAEVTETALFNELPYAAEPSETEPFETEPFETEPFETESFETGPFEKEPFETQPEATLPPLPPPPPAPPAPEELSALPPLPPPPPAPAPAPLSAPTLAVDDSDLSMFASTAPTEEPVHSGLDLPLPPPPPPLFGESDPQSVAPVPPAWDTPVATPVPTENPTRSSLFTEPAAEPLDAFDSPFPTEVAPIESYSLQQAEPAPFPAVEQPHFDAGSWNTSTGEASTDAAMPTDGVSLFGLPTTAGNLFSEPTADALEEWPSSISGDWPSTNSESAVHSMQPSGTPEWPATAPADADPLLTPVISPEAASAVGAFATPPDDGSSQNDVEEVPAKPARESFFKKILSRKEAPVESSPFMCASCAIPARVDIDNPSLGVRHLSCPKCAKMWTEPFEEEAAAVH